jgi:tripartite-type tricarboxylate transporter receptor subunit TctC
LRGVKSQQRTTHFTLERHETSLTDPKLKARFAGLGSSTFVGSPSDFGRLIADESEKWAKVVKFANIKPE